MYCLHCPGSILSNIKCSHDVFLKPCYGGTLFLIKSTKYIIKICIILWVEYLIPHMIENCQNFLFKKKKKVCKSHPDLSFYTTRLSFIIWNKTYSSNIFKEHIKLFFIEFIDIICMKCLILGFCHEVFIVIRIFYRRCLGLWKGGCMGFKLKI